MTTKLFEIRDRATFIPALAIRVSGEDGYLMQQAGFENPMVYLIALATQKMCLQSIRLGKSHHERSAPLHGTKMEHVERWRCHRRGVHPRRNTAAAVEDSMKNKIAVICLECGTKFKTTKEIPECPKCHGTDIDVRS